MILSYQIIKNCIAEVVSNGLLGLLATVALAISSPIITTIVKQLLKIFTKGGLIFMNKIMKWLYANKISLSATIANSLTTATGITASWTIQSLPELLVEGFNVAPIIYTAVCILSFIGIEFGITGRGFETVIRFLANKKIIDDKKAEDLIEKQKEALIKQAEKQQKKAEQLAQEQIQIQEELTKIIH